MLGHSAENYELNMYKRGMFENVAVRQRVTIGGKSAGATTLQYTLNTSHRGMIEKGYTKEV